MRFLRSDGRQMKKTGRIEQCVERLCEKGCRAVWADIAALEAGEPLAETRHLDAQEVGAVVSELREIMAVYAGSCTPH